MSEHSYKVSSFEFNGMKYTATASCPMRLVFRTTSAPDATGVDAAGAPVELYRAWDEADAEDFARYVKANLHRDWRSEGAHDDYAASRETGGFLLPESFTHALISRNEALAAAKETYPVLVRGYHGMKRELQIGMTTDDRWQKPDAVMRACMEAQG